MPACPHCAGEVQESAETCPACGRPVEPGQPPIKPKVSALAVAAFWLGIVSASFPATFITVYLFGPFLFGGYFDAWVDYLHGALTVVLYLSPFLGVGSIVAALVAHQRIIRSTGSLRGTDRAWFGFTAGSLGILPYLFVFGFWALMALGIVHGPGTAPYVTRAGCLRTINDAAEKYRTIYHRGYPESLSVLGGPMPVNGKTGPPNVHEAGLIDAVLASGHKGGLVIVYTVTARDENNFPTAYTVTVAPVTGCGQGGHCYFTDQTGVIRNEINRMPDEHSPPIAG